MRAVILVGGFGTRLRPLTLTVPKQMLPIVEMPMIERKITHLVSQGVDDIVLSMGYKPDAFEKAFPDGRCAGAKLQYVVESEPLGTAGAIAFAARQGGITDTFLAFNGDTLTDLDVQGLVDLHRGRGAEGTIALTPVDDPSRFGVVPTSNDGRVEAFIEKPDPGTAPTNLINAGTYVLEASFLDRVPEGRQVSIEREVFPDIVDDGGLYAGHFDRYWLDVGTPESYLQGNLDILAQSYDGAAFVASTAEVDPTVLISSSVVGAGVRIEAGSVIENSVLMPNAVVRTGVTIKGSILGENSQVGPEASLTGLCVVGGGQSVDAGATLVGEKVSPPQV